VFTTCLAQLVFLDKRTKQLREQIMSIHCEILPVHLRVHLQSEYFFHYYNDVHLQYGPGVDSASNRNEYQEYQAGE
jgi:hypothetical protein